MGGPVGETRRRLRAELGRAAAAFSIQGRTGLDGAAVQANSEWKLEGGKHVGTQQLCVGSVGNVGSVRQCRGPDMLHDENKVWQAAGFTWLLVEMDLGNNRDDILTVS